MGEAKGNLKKWGMPSVSPLRPTDPQRLGDYQLIGRLGAGGQGVVYLGSGKNREEVAIKVLHSSLASDPAARARFEREIASLRKVAAFCTAQILYADVEGDFPYLVSEHVPGPSLREAVDKSGPFGGSALMRLAIGTVTGLVAIHRAGVVHRDFKPHNVLLGPDGPRVIDFGIAHLFTEETTGSRLIGTPSLYGTRAVCGRAFWSCRRLVGLGSNDRFLCYGYLCFWNG